METLGPIISQVSFRRTTWLKKTYSTNTIPMNNTRLQILIILMAVVGVMRGATPRTPLRDSVPERWQMTQQCFQTLPTEDAWWKTFHDPILDKLIDKAVANNYNVAAAIKRIEMAKKVIGETKSGYYPTLSASAGWNRQQESGAISNPVMPSSKSSYFSVGADMNWEIDVFGRIRENVKSKKAAYNASRAEYDAVMVSLCANVASSYMQLRMYQSELAVATSHIASQDTVVKITEARFEAELASMLDVTQARIVLYNTQNSVPTIKAQIGTLINTLSVLTGEYPGALAPLLEPAKHMPDYRQTVSAGVPADLLRRRPDIVEAEMELAEYAALVGVAKKDFLPTLSLTGSIGTSARKAGDLFGSHSMTYSVAPQLSWTIFDGLARNYRTAEAKLQMEAAVDNYNMTVLNAVEEVDNAMIDYLAALESIELQKKVVAESRRSMQLSVDLYRSGLTEFTNVVDGLMSYLESEETYVTLRGKALTSLVTIYQALGGGWTAYPDPEE